MPRTRQLSPRQPAPPFRKSPLAPQPDVRPPVGPGGARAQDCGVPGGCDSHRQHSVGAPGGVR
eukprot:6898743-Alexandrium_andersonii.AAC.1